MGPLKEFRKVRTQPRLSSFGARKSFPIMTRVGRDELAKQISHPTLPNHASIGSTSEAEQSLAAVNNHSSCSDKAAACSQ